MANDRLLTQRTEDFMSSLLYIRSSIFQDQGQSSLLADDYLAHWRAENPKGQVILRDLVADPLPHLDLPRFQAFATPAENRSPEQQQLAEKADFLIQELESADQLLIGLPMYNFTMPTQLKSYFDYVARAGRTFRYTENGPEGLLKNKRATVIATRGGFYKNTAQDTQTGLVTMLLGFLGVEDVKFIYAEGISISAEQKEKSLQAARSELKAA